MRRINTTIVNVQINDRTDRVNVVATLRQLLQRSRLYLREACKSLAKRMFLSREWSQAAHAVCAVSPSWGGHRPSGGSGTARRS